MITATSNRAPTQSATGRRRPRNTLQLTAARTAFKLLDRMAPDVAARWALRIWCTVPNTRGRRRDERTSPGETSRLALPDGRSVAVEIWGEGEPVYLMHGWGGWRGQLGGFVDPLVTAGRRVVAVDAPSHGESAPGILGPGRATAIEFIDALTAATATHGRAGAVVAHSLGCTSTALAIAGGMPVEKLALLAPHPNVMSLTRAMSQTLGYGARTRALFDTRLKALAGRPLADFDLTALPGPPGTLVVHDLEDKESPYTGTALLADSWEDAELLTTTGLGHQRILRDPDVIAAVVAHVTS